MDTLTHETPQQAAPRRPRRTWLIVIIAVLVVAGVAVGTWAIIDANQGDDLAIATEFADTWVDAWQTRGGEALAALFTEDGVWVDEFGTYEGRTAIRAHVATYGLFTSSEHGDVTELEEAVFTFPVEAFWYGADWVGEVEIRLDGDLVAHAELVTWEQVD